MNEILKGTMGYIDESKPEKNNFHLYHTDGTVEPNKTYQVFVMDSSASFKDKLQALNQLINDNNSAISMNKKDVNAIINDQEINMEIAFFLKEMSRIMGYLFNSHSWYHQDFQRFDKAELLNRLDKLKYLLK